MMMPDPVVVQEMPMWGWATLSVLTVALVTVGGTYLDLVNRKVPVDEDTLPTPVPEDAVGVLCAELVRHPVPEDLRHHFEDTDTADDDDPYVTFKLVTVGFESIDAADRISRQIIAGFLAEDDLVREMIRRKALEGESNLPDVGDSGG